jgi:hypothetical protein
VVLHLPPWSCLGSAYTPPASNPHHNLDVHHYQTHLATCLEDYLQESLGRASGAKRRRPCSRVRRGDSGGVLWRPWRRVVTCNALATHRPIYSYFPALGHHHSLLLYQYTPILSPQPLQALTRVVRNESHVIHREATYRVIFYQIVMLITVINDAAVSISGSVLVEAQLSYPPSIYLRTYFLHCGKHHDITI